MGEKYNKNSWAVIKQLVSKEEMKKKLRGLCEKMLYMWLLYKQWSENCYIKFFFLLPCVLCDVGYTNMCLI